jgi:hypothetical protein
MSVKAKKHPTFPVNYGWVTSTAPGYRPRNCSAEVQQRLCEIFLRSDSDFVHLLRQCTGSWIVTVVLGKTSVYLNIYDTDVVDDLSLPTRSQSLPEATCFFEVNRLMNLHPISEERQRRVRQRHPMFYAQRTLRQQDIKQLDASELAMTGDIGQAKAEATVGNLLEEIREAEQEVPVINRTPLLNQSVRS